MIVALQGGAGNQLFQYAFGRSVSLARNEELFFQKINLAPGAHRDYYLDAFNTKIQWANGRMGPYYKETAFRFDPGVYTAPEGSFFNGFWQTEKYFNVPVIREDLQFKKIPNSPKIVEIAEKINSIENSAFIHVRRTDYLREPHKSYHGSMTMRYYNDATNLIQKIHGDSQFFVFSDDPAWCRTAFPDYTTVDGTGMFEDLYLMTLCRHAVLANSSFGWWGAWLNARTDKTVIAPHEWFQNPNTSYDDVVPERWTKL